jgi:hypothetical protein
MRMHPLTRRVAIWITEVGLPSCAALVGGDQDRGPELATRPAYVALQCLVAVSQVGA